MPRTMNRRDFVASTVGTGLTAALPSQAFGKAPAILRQNAVQPVVVSSSNGNLVRNGGPLTCVETAFEMMTSGSDVLEALITGVNIVELDPEDASVGYGGRPNADGIVQLDACCMHGPTRRAGGVAALGNALKEAAEVAGTEIRFSAEVARVRIDGNADGLSASGVHLADGETIEADRVVCATDAKRAFLGLVGVEYLDIGFTNRIRRLRSDGLVGKLHLALKGAPEFGSTEHLTGRMIIAPTMDSIEFAFDDAKYGQCPEDR